jgi:hypothetical protein
LLPEGATPLWIGVHVLVLFVAVPLILSLLAFWVWMLVDCLTKEEKEGSNRLIWTLAIILTKFLGATLYYFLGYRKSGHLRTAESSDPAV